jgi:hypothetical protein
MTGGEVAHMSTTQQTTAAPTAGEGSRMDEGRAATVLQGYQPTYLS